jgi:hypothetical protein
MAVTSSLPPWLPCAVTHTAVSGAPPLSGSAVHPAIAPEVSEKVTLPVGMPTPGGTALTVAV